MEPVSKRLADIANEDKREKVRDVLGCLVLTDDQIRNIMDTMKEQIKFANDPDECVRKKSDLGMENTFVRRLLEGNENGDFLGLDLGGTNFRVVRVTFRNGVAHNTLKSYTLSEDILSGPTVGVFDYIAGQIESFLKEENISMPAEQNISLGFTFSFPSVQKSIDHCIIRTWTKSFKCPDGPGEDPVVLLEEAVERRGGLPVDIVCVIRDTTGTLMAGRYLDVDCRIGLIIGTGSNACFIDNVDNIDKWTGDRSEPKQVIIDCEFGAFGDNGCLDFFKTEYDKEVDEHSNHVASFTFEKLYGGHYLGELIRLVLVKLTRAGLMFGGNGSEKLFTRWKHFTTTHVTGIESDNGPDTTNTRRVLTEMDLEPVATDADVAILREVCALVSQRGAYIAAAAMCVLLQRIGLPDVTIGVDGSLFEQHPKYRTHMADVVSRIVPETKTKIILVKEGSGFGAAYVAAVAVKQKSG